MDTATASTAKIPWNKGKIVGQKSPLKLNLQLRTSNKRQSAFFVKLVSALFVSIGNRSPIELLGDIDCSLALTRMQDSKSVKDRARCLGSCLTTGGLALTKNCGQAEKLDEA